MARSGPPLAAGIAFATCLLPASCIPVPIPPLGYGETRGNIPDKPEFIVEGRTTREDVLLRLGTPDAASTDASWIAYANRKHQGGVALVAGGGGGTGGVVASSYRERRLIIHFDVAGVVSNLEFEEKECPGIDVYVGAGGEESKPCLSPYGVGTDRSPAPSAPPATETVVATFDDVVWGVHPAETRGARIAGSPDPGYAAYRGPVTVTNASLYLSGRKLFAEETGRARIAYGDIDTIARQAYARMRIFIVTTTNGAIYTMEAAKGMVGADPDRTEELIAAVEKQLKRPAHPP